VDISDMKPDEIRTVEWRGKPVWVLRRNPAQVKELSKLDGELADPNSQRDPAALTPAYARNEYRSIKPEYLVVVGICSHLGCSPSDKFQMGPQPSLPDDWQGGFFCPCHGSTFDMAGRVYKNKPAPDNLEVPPHMYLSDTRLLIGEDKKA
jgi:ubiquinol-cytochrome c reductase iron-sulfur subunit